MSLIYDVLEPIRSRLDSALKEGATARDSWAVLSNLATQEGGTSDATRNKIVLTLAGLQHDATIGAAHTHEAVNGRYGMLPPPLHLNAIVLVLANFVDESYGDGLRMLSRAISFFQRTPVFTGQTLPGLPAATPRVAMEVINLDFGQMSHLFGMHGLKYLPSIVYRLRTLPFVAAEAAEFVPAVASTHQQSPSG